MNKKNHLISRSQATKKYCRSETTIWRDERDGLIPAAIRINGRKFWIEADLDFAYLGEHASKLENQ